MSADTSEVESINDDDERFNSNDASESDHDDDRKSESTSVSKHNETVESENVEDDEETTDEKSENDQANEEENEGSKSVKDNGETIDEKSENDQADEEENEGSKSVEDNGETKDDTESSNKNDEEGYINWTVSELKIPDGNQLVNIMAYVGPDSPFKGQNLYLNSYALEDHQVLLDNVRNACESDETKPFKTKQKKNVTKNALRKSYFLCVQCSRNAQLKKTAKRSSVQDLPTRPEDCCHFTIRFRFDEKCQKWYIIGGSGCAEHTRHMTHKRFLEERSVKVGIDPAKRTGEHDENNEGETTWDVEELRIRDGDELSDNIMKYVGKDRDKDDFMLLESYGADDFEKLRTEIQRAAMEQNMSFFCQRRCTNPKRGISFRMKCWRYAMYTRNKSGKINDKDRKRKFQERASTTALAIDLKHRCRFSLIVKFDDILQRWYFQGGTGCRTHNNHPRGWTLKNAPRIIPPDAVKKLKLVKEDKDKGEEGDHAGAASLYARLDNFQTDAKNRDNEAFRTLEPYFSRIVNYSENNGNVLDFARSKFAELEAMVQEMASQGQKCRKRKL